MNQARVLASLLAMLALPLLVHPAFATAKKDEAAAISQIAMAKAKAGDFKLCAELYQQAYRTDPAFLGYLYSAARCSQKGGDLDGAEKAFRALLSRAPPDHALAPRAQKHIEQVLEARAKAPPVKKPPTDKPVVVVKPVPPPKPATPVVVVKPPPPPPAPATWKGPAGWTGLIAGGLSLGVGGWLLIDGLLARGDLVERLEKREGGLVVGITPTQAHADEEAYQANVRLGGIMTGAGVLLAGLGGWMLATAPESPKVTLLPGPTGLHLIVAWR